MTDRPRTWEIGVFSRAPQVGPAIAGPHPGDNDRRERQIESSRRD